MTSIQHHLTDETLQEYAAGVLSQPMETVIACHLTLCPTCRHRSDMADALGGAAISGEEVSAMKGSAEDIIAMANAMPVTSAPTLTAAPKGTGLPQPLARLLPNGLEDIPWKSFGPGMKHYNLGSQPRKEGAFKLLSLEPDSQMSAHTHGHRELTFIISGSYSDELGQYRAGDIADLSTDHHTPHVDSDEPCICLIATDAPVKFDGLFGKIVQPFVGI